MLSAKKARVLSDAFKNPSDLFKDVVLRRVINEDWAKQQLLLVGGNIADNIRNGFGSTVTYYQLIPAVKNILTSHGYIVEDHVEDDVIFTTISWEKVE